MGIRAATRDDVATLAALVREYWDFEGIRGYDEARVSRTLALLLDTPALGRAWLAEEDGRAVGYLVACLELSIEHGGVMGEIDELFVQPAHRGAGLGARLLATAEEALAAAGCPRLSLEVGRANARARAFYERCGFAPRDHYDTFDKALPARAKPA